MNKVQKQRILSDPEKFKSLLVDLIILDRKAAEARKLNIDESKVIQWKIEKHTKRILADELISQYKSNVKVPDNIEDLAKEYYDGHPEEFTIKETIKVTHILLAFENKKDEEEKIKLAEKVLEEIKQGLSFNDAAIKYSDDEGSASAGGVINYFTRGKMVKPFEEAAFALKAKDDMSKITKSRFGYHIIKLLDRKEQSIKPYNEVKDSLVESQKAKFIKSKVNEYSNSFNADKNTIIHMPAIKTLIEESR